MCIILGERSNVGTCDYERATSGHQKYHKHHMIYTLGKYEIFLAQKNIIKDEGPVFQSSQSLAAFLFSI